MTPHPTPAARRPQAVAPPVVLTIPADKDYVVLVRSAAGHLGARVGLSMEELGDLRLAVNEACAVLLLPEEIDATGATLDCRLDATGAEIRVTVAVDADRRAVPRIGGFGWSLLSALVDDLEWSNEDGRVEVSLTKRPAARGR